jgi:hypothetical protein
MEGQRTFSDVLYLESAEIFLLLKQKSESRGSSVSIVIRLRTG